jgi:hypothetical protein
MNVNYMQTNSKKVRASGSLSGAAGVHFVAGELSRLGYISLPTVKNTKGVDIVVSSLDFRKTVYLQVKTNKNKYNFWIVGNPVRGDNIFYAFVNLLSNQKNMRPEYYVVPSEAVYAKFLLFENVKDYDNLTAADKNEVIRNIHANETAWSMVENLGISVDAIRTIAQQNNLKIKYDRGKGADFPFCFYIRKTDEPKYANKWTLLFP